MFEKIKKLLSEIEENKSENKKENEEKLSVVLSTINKIEDEISSIEKRAEVLLDDIRGEEQKETAESTGFRDKIQSTRVNITTLIDKGWNQIVTGKYKEAIETLKRAKKMDPQNVKVYNLLGWAYIHLEKYDKSSLVFQEVLKLDPTNEMAQANLGYINHKKGLYGEAIEKLSMIEKKAKNKQAVLYALFYLGLVYFEREMYEDSIEFLNKAISVGPNLYEAYYYLGMAYEKMEMNNLSRQIWEKLIEISKYNIWSERAKEKLNG